MPYQSIEYVNQYSECANLTHVDVNNAMRQLLENDLYVENVLNTTSSYIIGPKTDENLSDKLNGYKTYGGLATAETLEILHKVDKPLSGTVHRIQTGDTKFVTVWSDILFIGRTGQLLQYSLDESADDFQTLPITATGFYQDGDRILFSATDGVYQLSSYIEDNEMSADYGTTYYGVARLNLNGMSGLKSIHLNRNTWQITAGGETCVYQGIYDPEKSLPKQKLSIKFEAQQLFDEDDDIVSEAVNAIGSDGRVTIAGTDSGVFQPKQATVFKDAQSLYQYSGGTKLDKNYSVIAEFDGIVYVGAENGLFKIDGNALTKVSLTGGDISEQVVDIKVKNSVMYVATSIGVYSVSKTMVRSGNYLQLALPDNRIPSTSVVRKILVNSGQIYVCTSAGLYCFVPDDIVYISEVCTDGTVRTLPAASVLNRFGDIRDICVKNESIVIGTANGVTRLEPAGTEQHETKIIKQFSTYSDVRGRTLKSGRILKILQDAQVEGAYIIMPDGICNSSELEKKWMPTGVGETVTDAVFADIDGTKRIIATTDCNTYVLQLGSGPTKIAQPAMSVPGVAVAANLNMIIVAGSDGICRYSYNSLDKIKRGQFSQLTCGITQLETYGGNIYGVGTDGKARAFWSKPQPTREDIYVDYAMTAYAWSTVQNGYLFVRAGRLIFKGVEHEYAVEPGHTGGPELTVRVLDDVDNWYSGSDVTFVYVDDTHNVAYIGTQTTLLSAALADASGGKITTPAFVECVCASEHTFGKVNCICKGYTKSNGTSPAYSCGSYTSLRSLTTPIPSELGDLSYEQVDVNVSEGESIFAATENGLFEFKVGGAKFDFISSTVYKAISATPKLFVGITSGNKVHTCANSFAESTATGTGIKPGTKSDSVTYTLYTVTSTFAIREHTNQVSDAICSLKVFDEDSNHIIYAAGGTSSILKNTVDNGSLATFQFSPTSYGYVQSVVDVKAVQPPDDRPTSVYDKTDIRAAQDSYEDTDGIIKTRYVAQRLYKTYIPISYIISGFDGYSDYVLYGANGIYALDNSNIIVSQNSIAAASGSVISRAVRMLTVPNMLMIICGNGEGIQTVEHNFTRTGIVADDIEYADGNYYFKTPTEWRYMSAAQLLATSSSATVNQATSLKSVFESAGVPVSENVVVKVDVGRTVYVGTSTKGLMQVVYFSYDVIKHAISTVPAIFSGSDIRALNSASKANDILVVRRLSSGKYEICDYNLVTNTASVGQYQIECDGALQPISQFSKVQFANLDGSAALYVVNELGDLFYTHTTIFKTSPRVGNETFFDLAYIYAGTEVFMAREGKVFRFAEIGTGTAWAKLSDTGAVNSMCDISGGKCLITTSTGLWYYDEIEQIEETVDPETGKSVTSRWYEGECVQLRKVDDGIDGICKYIYDGAEQYIYMSGQDMLSSSNYKRWKPVLQWRNLANGQPTSIASAHGVYMLNNRTFFAAANNGAYMTKYDYDMVQDTKAFTKNEALSVYDELFQTIISAKVSALLSNHVSADPGDHSENAIITQINKHYLNVDLDNITDWSSSVLCNDIDGYVDVTNDIVSEMYFGEYSDGDVMVNVSSFLTQSGSVSQSDVTYIMKRWSSGVTELYINVPTTSSYYLANCFGASNCKHDPSDAYFRKNLEQFGSDVATQDSILSTHWTSLSVGIASASYHIDNLLDVQINGMSLPLAVYKDQTATGDTGIAGKMYRSYIEPSLVRNYDISKTDNDGNYVFEFACFGTDAQAIKLMFYDEKSRTAADCVKVVFDPNGGEGKMPNQKFVIAYDVNGKTILEPKELRLCKFTNGPANSPKTFIGWSIYPLADNSDPTYIETEQGRPVFPAYTSGETFEALMEELGDASRTEPLKKNEIIRLYAVWVDYKFSDTDTTLMMKSDKSEFYIDSVGVDPSTKLRNKVLINFGD